MRRGASWTAEHHLQLTVAAVARPVRSSVGALGVLAAERSWVVARPDGVCPAERPAGIQRSGVVAVVDTASRPATASVAGVQHTVSTHPVSASGIRLSSRPVSGHLGRRPEGPGGRPSAVHPSSVQPSAVHPSGVRPSAVHPSSVQPDGVQPDGVHPLCPSGRVRLLPNSGGGAGDQVGAAEATITTGTGRVLWAAAPSSGSIDGRGGLGRATLPTSRWSVGGRWRTRAAGLGAGRRGRA